MPITLRRFLPVGLAFAAALSLAAPRPAEALTISLDFVTGATTDALGVHTTTADYSAFGFTSMSTAQIQSSILSAVVMDYLGFPTAATDASSPLAAGKQLDINFVMSSGATTPTNGDSEYYFVAIGKSTGGDTFLGQACISCVRNSSGVGPNFGAHTGTLVGSILVDNIAALAGLADTDIERVNLLAETVAHEVGHSLSLEHPDGPLANPGDSIYSIMGTGASPTNMPNDQRILDRAFAYTEFSQLIGAVGVRDADVPEPASWMIFAFGTAALVRVVQRRRG